MLSQLSPSDQTFQMKSGSIFSIPGSWKHDESKKYVQITGPENDFSVAFFEHPLSENLEKSIDETWKQIHPDFSLNISQRFSHPVTWFGGGWDSVQQFLYDVPESEGQVVTAFVRIYKDKIYLNLIEGKSAALHRRGAELQRLLESWKPNGFIEPHLDKKAKKWTPTDEVDFDHFIQKGMEKLKVPGLAIAIVSRDGKILFTKGYGVRKLGSAEAITVDTPFMIGSTTKALTTFLMGTLVDQKKMTWDTPVTEVMKDFRLGDPDLTKKLTARLTVSACTGMPRRDFDFIFNYSDVRPQDRLAQMRDMKPTTGFGETFQYSNLLFMVGGYMAAKAYSPLLSLEDAYAQAMKELVFEPLHMKHTAITHADAMALEASYPHSLDFNGELRDIPLSLEGSCSSIAPSGAIWSTVRDMSQYLLMELNNGTLNAKRLISEENLLERRKASIRMGEKSYYGLGLIINDDQGLPTLGHAGVTLGFASELLFYPDAGIGITILANSRYAHPLLNAIKQKCLELTFAAKPQAEEIISISVDQQREMLRKNREDVSLMAEDVQWMMATVGDYSNPTLGNARIYQDKGFNIACKEWISQLGAHIDKNGKKHLVLIDPPSGGFIRLRIMDNGNLLLDAGQDQYEFKKLTLRLDETNPSYTPDFENQSNKGVSDENKLTESSSLKYRF